MSAPSLTVNLVSNLTVVETINDPYISPDDSTITENGLNESITLTGTSSPAATQQASFQQALSSGAATISLEALPGLTPSETVNGVGLKVQMLKLRNLAANANKIVVSQGASNGYRLDGATNWSIPLAPGQSILMNLDGAADAIGSTHLNIDLAGTLAQVLECEIVMG